MVFKRIKTRKTEPIKKSLKLQQQSFINNAVDTCMETQSQVPQESKSSNISTLDFGHFCDSIYIPRKLSPIMISILSRMHKKLTFGARGKIINLNQVLDESVAQYCEALGIKEPARVSQAFTKLQKLNIVKSTRTKAGMDRQFHPEFLAEMIKWAHARSSMSQSSSCLIKHPPPARSGTSHLPDQAPPPLDRRLDGRIDERLDGRETPSPPKGGGKISPMAKDYAVMFQDLYHGSYRYLAQKEFEKFNDYVQKTLNKRGEAEFGEFLVFAATMIIRRDAMDRRKISLLDFQGLLARWDDSQEKQNWQQNLKKVINRSEAKVFYLNAPQGELGAL